MDKKSENLNPILAPHHRYATVSHASVCTAGCILVKRFFDALQNMGLERVERWRSGGGASQGKDALCTPFYPPHRFTFSQPLSLFVPDGTTCGAPRPPTLLLAPHRSSRPVPFGEGWDFHFWSNLWDAPGPILRRRVLGATNGAKKDACTTISFLRYTSMYTLRLRKRHGR